MAFYCGSNRLNPQLIGNGGNKTIGTRNDCLRKGIGVGLHMPVDLNYNNPYQPIDNRRFYCGNGNLPNGYDANGTLQQCFATGVGVGRRQLAQRANGGAVVQLVPPLVAPVPLVAPLVPISNWIIYAFVYIVINAIFIVTMIYAKPKFIMTDKQEIDWNILAPYIALFSLLTGFIIYHRFSIN